MPRRCRCARSCTPVRYPQAAPRRAAPIGRASGDPCRGCRASWSIRIGVHLAAVVLHVLLELLRVGMVPPGSRHEMPGVGAAGQWDLDLHDAARVTAAADRPAAGAAGGSRQVAHPARAGISSPSSSIAVSTWAHRPMRFTSPSTAAGNRHSRAVRSQLPVRMVLPSGLKAAARTRP